MDVVETLRQQEDVIKRRFGVRRIGVFGSFARGEESKDSDIDILVEFEAGQKTFDNYMDLKFFLEDLFGRSVDLATVQALKSQIKDDILQSVIYA